MGGQRTFDLIPTSLVVSKPKPPMTSKQAKKAHQLATRGVKVTKAEQRRRDAEELARIRKENERERASAKAKAVREKKAAREQAEREERKRLGQPAPSRFVRASQPTISRFVKKGNKRTWEVETVEEAEHSDTSTVCDDGDLNLEPQAKKVKVGGESEDEYGAFPSFSQSELGVVFEEIESSAPSENKQDARLSPDTTPQCPNQSSTKGDSATRPAALPPHSSGPNYAYTMSARARNAQPAGALPVKKSSDDYAWESLEDIDEMVNTQLLLEAAAAVRSRQVPGSSTRQAKPALLPPRPVTAKPCSSISRSRSPHDNPKTRPTPKLALIACPSVSGSKPPHVDAKVVQNDRQALQDLPLNMPPPPLPITAKSKRAISFAPSPLKPRTLPRILPRTISIPNPPPSATQAFLEDHLDDFFPSPSQEIRELLDDIGDLPTNTQIARELDPEPDLPINKAVKSDSFDDLICTQDFVLSSQDILEITTPCPPALKPKRSAEVTKSTPTPTMKMVARQPKRRFFEEKEEDLLYAAIQESKALAVQQEQRELERKSAGRMQEHKLAPPKRDERGPGREVGGRSKRILQRTVSNVTDYGEDEFHDCEEELLALC